MNRVLIAFLILGLLALSPQTAVAQRRSETVAGFSATHSSSSSGEIARTSGAAKSGGVVNVANGALIGAGLGALIGLVASPIVNAQNSDHTEDGMTYVMLIGFGAFIGLIAGGIAGGMRGS